MTRTAEALFTSQSSISLIIVEIENHYSTKLVDRFGKKLRLTKDGERFYEYAKALITDYATVGFKYRSLSNQYTLFVGCSASCVFGYRTLPLCTKAFALTHPEIKTKVYVSSSNEIRNLILTGKLSFAMMADTESEKGLDSVEYLPFEHIAITSYDQNLPPKKSITLDDLVKRCVLPDSSFKVRSRIDIMCANRSIPLSPVLESMSYETIIAAVSEGIGTGIVPYVLAEQAIRDHLVSPLYLEDVNLTVTDRIYYSEPPGITKIEEDFIKTWRAVAPDWYDEVRQTPYGVSTGIWFSNHNTPQ